MKSSPCSECKNSHLSKLKPFLWIEKETMKRMPKDHENGTLSYIPGRNYPNPCYDCKNAQEYADWVSEYLDYPPVNSNPLIPTAWETIQTALHDDMVFGYQEDLNFVYSIGEQ